MNKIILPLIGLLLVSPIMAQKSKKGTSETKTTFNSSTFSGLEFRNIGPALTSGRVADIAVNPNHPEIYYVAAASGGVWKTTNAGTTYEPIFDGQGSYSIGCITIDPSNENIIWVGTGENNNQRSVAYGDGVYKSEDGGKSWKNVGLKTSEHIGMIKVHPKKSEVVYVAAYGPLWSAGGERGLYKTDDGGQTWKLVLETDENTGVNEVHFDPTDAKVMYATTHQRRRHVFTYISGGPGCGIQKSEDGGKTWKSINNGLPEKMGRIGMTVSPVNHNILYAIVEAEGDKGGFFRSMDRGASWNKMNSFNTSGNYYQELIADPKDEHKVFIMDTWLHHTTDGGKTIVETGEDDKHVDNHCIWIDPINTNHWIVGCDGGLYETFDHAQSWEYKDNLPITQFYKVAVDNDYPFYNVYGGTQDNNSLGGPSRTMTNHGIMNSDWYITNGGDGFESAIDPVDANIVYAQSQYGWLVRYDKKNGEITGIKPQAKMGDPALRWNWDAPLLISPHNHKRLYFAANVLFRSDDQGNSWQQISGDLTQQIDRNKLPVMGSVPSVDAVMKNQSTTIYGNIVALDESPKQEGLVYIGTDDGLIQVTEDNGANWRKISSFPGIPKNTYVNAIVCSKYEANTVYAVFNNHKNGDFKPYVLKSSDKGMTWSNITGNLPERGSVYDIIQDHVNPKLMFAGTEFGCFVTIDEGKNWTQLKSGLPTIAIRDLEIQERENDLVLASFGRGFYILDDYTPLRTFTASMMTEKAILFPIKDGLMFIDSRPLGLRGKGAQGSNLYTAPNPEIGAVFSILINDTTLTLKEFRQKKENELLQDHKDIVYPSKEELMKEDQQEKPFLVYTILDANKQPIRKITTDLTYGLNRVVWDFRYSPSTPVQLKSNEAGRYDEAVAGPLALPGTYYVSIDKVFDGKATTLIPPTSFECKWLEELAIPLENKSEVLAFSSKVEKLRNATNATHQYLKNIHERIEYIEKAISTVPSIPLSYVNDLE
ncbi:MAG: glycosyl hydrolase, partial [Flavobacteriales bacterium]|nr:glycosyl hydrolase [Flavobacteriales bacterium]